MLNHSKILNELAQRYEKSCGGSAGQARRDFIVDLEDLLYWADCADGDQRVEAVDHLQQAEEHGALQLDRHPRDPRLIQVVRIKRGGEPGFYQFLGLTPPTFRREELARQFQEASDWSLPETYQGGWQRLCRKRRESALSGGSIEPFSREEARLNRELLDLTARLLQWQGDSLVHFASSVLCGDSERLPALQSKIETLLAEITEHNIRSLEELGIMDTPSTALFHGPLRLGLHGQWVELEPLDRPIRLSEFDLVHAEQLESSARRCITVENETSFHELSKLRCGDLLLCTAYPGTATLKLLERLPREIEFHHFGDADPAGFDILRHLRQRTGRPFQSLHMHYRPFSDAPGLTRDELRHLEQLIREPLLQPERPTLQQILAAGSKGRFEQESLGRPVLDQFPFYPLPPGLSSSGQ